MDKKENLLLIENNNIKKAIDEYIKQYEIYDDYNQNYTNQECHTIKHLTYTDMKKQVCNTVLGVLWHLKEYYSCPKCGTSEKYFIEFKYGRFSNPNDEQVYEIRECGECGYNEIIKRQEYKYDEKEWER